MPTYILHGFRWPRPLIRIHIILQNLDDAAAEWLVAPNTTHALLRNFSELYPETMSYLPKLRLIEQYDPADTTNASQPYAYVADFVHEVKLGVSLEEVTTKGIENEQWAAMMELRDRLAPEEKVTWFVVSCGDEERYAPPTIGQLEAMSVGGRSGSLAQRSSDSYSDHDGKPMPSPEEREPRGLKKLFGSARLKSRGKR